MKNATGFMCKKGQTLQHQLDVSISLASKVSACSLFLAETHKKPKTTKTIWQ